MGDLPSAVPLLEESLSAPARRRRLGKPPPGSSPSRSVELSRTARCGPLRRGRSLAREGARRLRRAAFGEEHNETATSKSDLGLLLLRRGDLAGAESLLRENVATTERLMGARHPNTASAKASLASVMLVRGDAADAERLLREAVDVDRDVFGSDRPEYAQMLNSLAGALEAEGRLQEAQSLFGESLRITEPELGRLHPRVGLTARSAPRQGGHRARPRRSARAETSAHGAGRAA